MSTPAEELAPVTTTTETVEVEPAAVTTPEGGDPDGGEPIAIDRPNPNAAREAIYARQRAVRATEAEADPERHAAVQEMAGRHADGQPNTGEEGVTPAASSTEALASSGKMVKLTVEGQQIEVPEDQVRDAGIRTLQKDHSADLKLRRASSAEQLAAETLADAERIRREAQQNPGGLPSSGARHDGAASPPSSQDAGRSAQAIALAAAQQAQAVLFEDGDTEKAAQVMVNSSRQAVVEETNQTFLSDFEDVAANPKAFGRAVQLMNAELAKNPSFARIPGIANRVGNLVRNEMLAGKLQEIEAARSTAPAAQQGSAPRIESREAVKLRLPTMPTRATTRTATSAAQANSQRLTPSQIVQNIQAARKPQPRA